MPTQLDPALDQCRLPNWYPKLSAFSLPTAFVALAPEEIKALADGEKSSCTAAKQVIARIKPLLVNFSYFRFFSVDLAAPTDTERFKAKGGSVRSAKSAWDVLASSEKVRESAKRGEVSCICIRPYRNMEPAREFRLFVKDGKLFAMSQYWLKRHYARFEKQEKKLWEKAVKFIEKNGWALPLKDVVVDVYYTSSGRVLITDLNPLGKPTDPLMFNKWENFDWSGEPVGIKLIPKPLKLSGDVNVSF